MGMVVVEIASFFAATSLVVTSGYSVWAAIATDMGSWLVIFNGMRLLST
jgi:hypothetical protein